MKELVIISGKGGTGKTSLCASFAWLAENNVIADCDVDAADLHILALPEVEHEEEFYGGRKARIDESKCTGCGQCRDACKYSAISEDFVVNTFACEGCAVCYHVCPEEAVSMEQCPNGRWFISRTRLGPMVHAALAPGEENSGKLVALVRNQAQVLANKRGKDLIIVDGAPGVGCPVISSVTGADHVIVVTEPTKSGLHDTERAVELVKGFNIPVSIILNKWDINPAASEELADFCERAGAALLGRIPYDVAVTKAMVARRTVVENGDNPVAAAIREIWDRVRNTIIS